MKTIQYFLLLVILATIYSCNDTILVDHTIDNINTKAMTVDYCISKEATLSKSAYNTDEGKATLYLMVPKGHNVYQTGKTKTSVSFETRGEIMSSQFFIAKLIVHGLSQQAGSKLNVSINIKNTGADTCGTRSEKKKKSVVDGSPKK